MKCNFCGKSRDEVVVLVASKTEATICDECIMLSLELLYKDFTFTRQVKIKLKAAEEKIIQLKNDLMVSLCSCHDMGDEHGKCSCSWKKEGIE